MTAVISAHSEVRRAPSEPAWCDNHLHVGPFAELHQKDLDDTWGWIGSERLGLALEREDDEAGAGPTRINVHFSRDGLAIDGIVSLSLEVAEDFLGSLAYLVSQARRSRR